MTLQIMTTATHLAVGLDGCWMGYDGVMALIAGTFPAWGLYTLITAWVREAKPVLVRVRKRR